MELLQLRCNKPSLTLPWPHPSLVFSSSLKTQETSVSPTPRGLQESGNTSLTTYGEDTSSGAFC